MSYKAEKILPFNEKEKKSIQVERMFDSIAGHYDTLNHTLSMFIDKAWRKKGILSLQSIRPRYLLDVATGTGDLAIEAYKRLRPDKILGIDISNGMMEIGKKKVEEEGLKGKIVFDKQDCCALEISNDTFDAAMVAFGLRNFENLDKGLKEIWRVLKPGGKLMILELSTPEKFPMRQGYYLYSRIIIPTIGHLISKSKAAYSYLPKSIAVFPQGEKMVNILKSNGFGEVVYQSLTFGICSMYVATKK